MSQYCSQCQAPLPPIRVERCPRCGAAVEAGEATEHIGTRLESVAEIRRAHQSASSGAEQPSKSSPPPPPRKPAPADVATPFRPTRRPSMALLCLYDDDGEDGEWFRLRQNKTLIGRTEGQITIPHDPSVSGSHLEISRVAVDGRFRWFLKDVGSTNGSYASISQAALTNGQEFIIGSARFRFEAPPPPAPVADADAGQRKTTQAWSVITPADVAKTRPALVLVSNSGGEDRRFPLTADEVWLGSDAAQSTIVPPGDAAVSAQHAKVSCDPHGRWRIESGKCRNGLWYRFKEMPVDGTAELLIGEQRLSLRVVK